MTYVEKAMENHDKGYNCAQAVFCAFSELLGLDEVTAYKISEGFGGGMGGLHDTCGAVTGAYMVISMKNSSGVLGDKSTRAASYGEIKEISRKFKELNGSYMCRDLKGSNGGPALRSCHGCVEDAARLTAELLGVE